jgi:5S rRNA maturation endonuclease (ribonuclease M5)
MVSWHKCSTIEVREFWGEVEKILVNGEYEIIKQLKLSLRNSWYHLLTFVSQLLEKGVINDRQFFYWQQKQAYDTFTQSKWVSWERKYNWVRPHAKDPTTAIYRGNLRDLNQEGYILESELGDFQGFMFIEKSGFLDDLKLLSKYGWCILAGQGFSTRELRETIKKTFSDKPIVVLHDYDIAGASIYEVFEKGSIRTEHIDLTFENMIDLGLREVDVEEFNLPKAPESAKHLKKNPNAWRVELNALTILYQTHGIKNPLLWYVAKRMFEEGLPLFEEPDSFFDKVESHLRWSIEYAIRNRTVNLIKKIFKYFDLEDELVSSITITEDNEDKWRGYFDSKHFDYLDNAFNEVILLELFSIGKFYPVDKVWKFLKQAGVKMSHEEIKNQVEKAWIKKEIEYE